MRLTEDIGHNHQQGLTPARDHNLGPTKYQSEIVFHVYAFHDMPCFGFGGQQYFGSWNLHDHNPNCHQFLLQTKQYFCNSLWCLIVNYSCVCSTFQMNYPLMDQQENGVFSLATIKHLHNIIADYKKYGFHHCLTFFFL
jgi:hypothetical protein